MTAGDLASRRSLGGHRPPLQSESRFRGFDQIDHVKKTMRLNLISTAVALICTVMVSALMAQSDVRIARAQRVLTAPVLDGNVNDAVWQSIVPIDGFIQSEPLEGQPATERTEVRIAYDEETLYVAVMCFDSEPDGILVKDSRRDSDLSRSEERRVGKGCRRQGLACG